MADHAYFEELICAELDGELTADQAAELRAHLEECEQCGNFRAAMAAVEGAAARNLPEPPAELAANVMAEVRARGKAQKKKGRILAFPGRSLAVAAAAALVLWAGVRATDLFRPKGSAAPMMAASQATGASYGTAPEEPPQAEEYAVMEEAPETEAAEDTGDLQSSAMPAGFSDRKNTAQDSAYVQICAGDVLLLTLPEGALPEGLLVIGKPRETPDREPDYTLTMVTPEGEPEEYYLWDVDGVLVAATPGGDSGYTVPTQSLLDILE